MNQTEQAAQITELRRQAVLGNIETLAALISNLSIDVIDQRQHIAELEQRIEKLETVLANWLEVLQESRAIPLFGLDLTE